MINIFYITHSGIAVPYLTSMLEYLKEENLICLQVAALGKVSRESIPSDAVIVYQTYADEQHHKFRPDLTSKTDPIILENSKRVILFDAHDSGSVDGFSRLPKLPRIKNTPNVMKMQEYNVVVPTTFPVKLRPYKPCSKDTDISFKVSLMEESVHPSKRIRGKIESKLAKYKYGSKLSIDLKKDKKIDYQTHLSKTRISVNAPGYGEACIRHLLTLSNNSCMLAHESIDNIKLLPGANLVEGDDYISFSLDTLYEKLDYLLSRPREIKRISANGMKKFNEGYPVHKPAIQLLNFIKENL